MKTWDNLVNLCDSEIPESLNTQLKQVDRTRTN